MRLAVGVARLACHPHRPKWPTPPFDVHVNMQVSHGLISRLQLILTITSHGSSLGRPRSHLVALHDGEEHNEMFHEIYRLNDEMRPTACSESWAGGCRLGNCALFRLRDRMTGVAAQRSLVRLAGGRFVHAAQPKWKDAFFGSKAWRCWREERAWQRARQAGSDALASVAGRA